MFLPPPLSLLPLLLLLPLSHQHSHHPLPRDLDPPFQIATAPNPSPSNSPPHPLVSLVSRLPQCLLPCYALVAQRPPLACDPADLGCVCQRRGGSSSNNNNLATLSLGIADCLMVGEQAGGLFAPDAIEEEEEEGEDDEEEEVLGCTLDDLDDLAELAGGICGMVGAGGVGRGEMEEAAGVVRGMMAVAGVSGDLGPGKERERLGVSGGRRRGTPGYGTGALVVVMGYGVVFL